MAYCVRCGVKLEAGSTVCPLCNTEVIAPPEVIGTAGTPLFPEDDPTVRDEHPMLDKRRKGFIELVIVFMSIAVITLAITAFALGASFSPWLPIGCVVLGGTYLLVLLFGKLQYTRIATFYAVITVALLFFIDACDKQVRWSMFANLSVGLFWVVFVFPWRLRHDRMRDGAIASIIAVLLFMLAVDALEGDGLLWFFPVALPTCAIVLISLGVLGLRMRFGKPSVTDTVLSLILSVCLGVVAGDFFTLRMHGSERLLSWSSSVFIVAVCLVILLTLSATIRKVRFFFNNRVV